MLLCLWPWNHQMFSFTGWRDVLEEQDECISYVWQQKEKKIQGNWPPSVYYGLLCHSSFGLSGIFCAISEVCMFWYVCSHLFVFVTLQRKSNSSRYHLIEWTKNPTCTIEGPVSDMQSSVVMVLTLWFSKSLLLFHLVDFSQTYEWWPVWQHTYTLTLVMANNHVSGDW
jgi:hypothetical protein